MANEHARIAAFKQEGKPTMGLGVNDMDIRDGKRIGWEFKFPTVEVLAAAEAKLAFFKGRLQWWHDQADNTESEIKSSGIEIDRSLAASVGYSNSGRDMSVKIKPELMRDIAEANSKIQEHKRNVKVYDGWVQFLSAATEDRLSLSHPDWLFFFGK